MESEQIVSIVVLAVLLVLSAYFSATETAFTSMNRIRMKSLADAGNSKAALALRMAANYGNVLSTILVGNNIVNIAATSIATVLFVGLFGAAAGPTASTVVMTVAVLIFGEISPKTLANEAPEGFAMFSAPLLRVLMALLRPINAVFAAWKRLLSRLFRFSSGPSITEEELLTLVDEAQQEGAINQDDKDLIRSAIDFNDSRVTDILTPRIDIIGLEKGTPMDKITQAFLNTGYTRLPVYDGSVDKIIGALHLRDFFECLQAGEKDITSRMGPVVFVTPFAKIHEVLKTLQKGKVHVAVVSDEYGGTVGMVTMEDILEELVGEIWDEHDEVTREVEVVAPGVWQVAGAAEIDHVFTTLCIDGQCDSTTVNGWIMEQLGRVPAEGDRFTAQGFAVTVNAMLHNRVLTATFARLPEEAGPADAAPADDDS